MDLHLHRVHFLVIIIITFKLCSLTLLQLKYECKSKSFKTDLNLIIGLHYPQQIDLNQSHVTRGDLNLDL